MTPQELSALLSSNQSIKRPPPSILVTVFIEKPGFQIIPYWKTSLQGTLLGWDAFIKELTPWKIRIHKPPKTRLQLLLFLRVCNLLLLNEHLKVKLTRNRDQLAVIIISSLKREKDRQKEKWGIIQQRFLGCCKFQFRELRISLSFWAL